MTDYTSRDDALFLPTYRRLPVEIESAMGCEIVAKDGRRYLDLLGGIAVNAAGHGNLEIQEAIVRQVRRYTHVSNFFVQDAQVEFAEKLARVSGYPRVFLSNSGTESIDGALKLVRKYGTKVQKRRVIAFEGSFHGRTYGALSLMDKPKYKVGMGPFLGDIEILPFNDVLALRSACEHEDGIAGIFVEFIQGEGGIREATPAFVHEIARAQREGGALIVADEIQGGAGRTGSFFSFSDAPIEPDIVAMAKVIGGGLPLGAILVKEDLAKLWSLGSHGTTFGGNAVSCAAGSALLDLIANGLSAKAVTVGVSLIEGLRRVQQEYPAAIVDVRGRGCMIGVEFAFGAAPVVDGLLAQGIIANSTSETVLRLLPPYILAEEEIRRFLRALASVLEELVA